MTMLPVSITVNEPRQPDGWRFGYGDLPARTRSRRLKRPRALSIRGKKLRNKYAMSKLRISFHFKSSNGQTPDVQWRPGVIKIGELSQYYQKFSAEL